MSREKIEEMARVWCPFTHLHDCDMCGCKKGCYEISKSEMLYNAGYRKQEWISVDERLPEEKANCLVHYKHAYCDNDGYWAIGLTFYDGNKFVIGKEYKITHWMPLPEPPKMKGGAE